MTSASAPSNVVGVDPSTLPNLSMDPSHIGTSRPNVLDALVFRAQELLGPAEPIDDSAEFLSTTTASEPTPAVLLMSTDEFGSPNIVGSVSTRLTYLERK